MIDLSCQEVRRHLDGLLDGELGGWKRILASRHLESCAACARQQRQLARLAVLLREAPAFAAPPDFLDGVNARLAGPPRPPGRRPLLCRRWRELSAAATLLVGGLLWSLAGTPPTGTDSPSHVPLGGDLVVESAPGAPAPLESLAGPIAGPIEQPLPLDQQASLLEQPDSPSAQPEAAPVDPAPPASTTPAAAGSSMEQAMLQVPPGIAWRSSFAG